MGCPGTLSAHPTGLWWAIEDLNLGPLACEASALTTELIALVLHSLVPSERLRATTQFGIYATGRRPHPFCPCGVATTGIEPVT